MQYGLGKLLGPHSLDTFKASERRMSAWNRYRIETAGSQFRLTDTEGQELGEYSTAEAANEDLRRRENEDAMLDTAKLLINVAVKAHMHIYGSDRETALYWIRRASDWEPLIEPTPAQSETSAKV